MVATHKTKTKKKFRSATPGTKRGIHLSDGQLEKTNNNCD